MTWMCVGMAPALEVEVVTAVAEGAAVPLVAAEVVVVVCWVALAGSSVPHLLLMLVVQFSWPLALPTLAVMHSWNACLQMY